MRCTKYATLPLVLLILSLNALAQSDPVAEAKAAMSKGEYARAVNILSQVVQRLTPAEGAADAYLNLGISYAHIREWRNAEETFRQGAEKFPADSRFHNELAGVYLNANDLERARASLRTSLAISPEDKYAADLLGSIDMSMGNVRAALDGWNHAGDPVVQDVLHNGHTNSENWVVSRATAFESGEVLTWSRWRTTESRLWRSGLFSSVSIEIEPTATPQYNAIIRASEKTNQRRDAAATLLLNTLLYQTPSLNLWNVRNSGVSLGASYRFSTNRHRAEATFDVPLPIPGLLFLETRGTWRSERWDISRVVAQADGRERFSLRSTGIRGMVRHVPHYRFEIGAGFEYRNRHEESGGTFVDRRDAGRLLFETIVRPLDLPRYQTSIRGEGFLAREALLSDARYSGGTVEVRNRYVVSADRAAYFDWNLKTGTTRGDVPIEDYFVLGLKQQPETYLRGHNAISSDGHFGNAPMGTEFWLVNTTFERRFRRIPLFNTLNVPYVDLKWEVFLDGGKTFDRMHRFQQGKLWIDAGGGFKLETPERSYHFIYGRSLRDGTDTFAAYVEKRW